MTQLIALRDVAHLSQGLVTSGRGAGSRVGDWLVRLISVGDIQDDRIAPSDVETIAIEQNSRTERHLLRPEDLLITARGSLMKVALVPPQSVRTVADATLLVIRPIPYGLGPYLWLYFTSSRGRAELEARMTGTTVKAMSAAGAGEITLPLPDQRTLDRLADYVDLSEQAYWSGIEAAQLRRSLVRDAIIHHLRRSDGGRSS